MNVLLVEDNQMDIEYFKLHSSKIQFIKNVDIAQTVGDAITSLQKNTYNLVFWDMVLKDYQGMEILKTFPNCPPVIALTSHVNYTINAYEVGFLDYILKPYSFERLLMGVNRAVDLTKTTEPLADIFVFFKVGRGFQKFQYENILYGESYGTFTKLYLTNKEVVLISNSITNVLDSLPTKSFKRIHRSYFINYNKITIIDNLRIKLEDTSTVLPLSKTYREQFSELLDRL